MYAESVRERSSMTSILRIVTLAVAALILAGNIPTATQAALHRQKRVASIRTTHVTEQRVAHSDPVGTALHSSSLPRSHATGPLGGAVHTRAVEAGLQPRQSRAPPGGMPRA
jgi:hypothetical protein